MRGGNLGICHTKRFNSFWRMPRGAKQRINLPSWGTFAKFMIQNLFAPKFERRERGRVLVEATRSGDEGEFSVALMNFRQTILYGNFTIPSV